MIDWGTGRNGTLDSLRRIDNLTGSDIIRFRDVGLTPELADEWADWYLDVSLDNVNNPSAEGRAQLIQYIADWMRELE